MKLGIENSAVEMSGGGAVSTFSIAMNSKAFKVLSDSLYQNKIGSIVRELSCNAMDSHIEAGKVNIPFQIHLPDSYEPWFSIQDFGIGLSPDAIINVYSKYFESTKDNTNSMVGSYGLGGKSGFSYTDQFTVTSIFNGTKRMYSAFITEQGIPSIVEMDSEATTECNGVEVRMSAKREDFCKFADEVATQLRFFKVKPTVTNHSDFKFKNISQNLAIDSEHIVICNDSVGYGETSWAHIIQGNVGYPLDVSQLKDKITKENATLLENINGSQVRFYFNIGDIGVTASREGVEYNKNTIANIDAKLTETRKIISDYIAKQLVGFITDYEKAFFINSSVAIGKLAKAAGITIPNVKTSYGNYYFDFSTILIHKTKKNPWNSDLQIGSVKCWNHGRTTRESVTAHLLPTKGSHVYFVLRDTSNRPNMRAKHFLDTLGRDYKLFEIDLNDESDGYTDAFIDELKIACGGYDKIQKLSEVVLPVITGSDGKKVKNNTYTRPTYYAHNKNSGEWIRQWDRKFDDLEEMDDDFVYVVIEDMALKNGKDSTAITDFNTYKNIDPIVPRLIGIRESDLKKIDGMNNYVPLQKYIDEVRHGYMDNEKMKVAWKHCKLAEFVNDNVNSALQTGDVMNSLKAIAPKSRATRFILFANSRYKNNPDKEKLVALANFMKWPEKYEKTFGKISTKIEKCWEEITERYPLLGVYNDWSIRGKIKPDHLAKYLTVM